MDKKGRNIIGGVTLSVYALIIIDFILSLVRAFMLGAGEGGIMASYVFVPFIVFVVLTLVQAVCLYGVKMKHVTIAIIALAKCIIVLLCTLLLGFTVLRSSFYNIDGVTAWGSLSCPVYATILVSLFVAFIFICAACEIIYIMRLNMEENMAARMAQLDNHNPDADAGPDEVFVEGITPEDLEDNPKASSSSPEEDTDPEDNN
ncbi:MAG: hypothetical protein LUE27_10000 [Clostridia bacterium]|nr:hypothetical protein [Clostridia bacterium]